jgi:uncharacterized protein (TIGR03435 family)
MNAIQLLPAQPWVERLGLTLLHVLWQGVLIAAGYAAVRRWTARSSGPNVRYLLACAALAAMAAAPVLTWNLLRPPAPDTTPVLFTAPVSAAASIAAPTAIRSVPASFPAGVYRAGPAPLMPWVVAVWIAGAMAFWLRLLGGWIFAERLRRRLVRPAPRQWQQALDRLKTRIRVSRPVRLLVSSLVQAPAVVGWLRPVVLVPVGALAGLPPEQMEALLLHELAHIRRHDYLVNVLQNVVEALLFYHPAVWWISGHIRAEREFCCDDVAVSVSGDVLTYARALAELESARPVHLRAVMAAAGGSLAHRIARLLGHSRPAPRTLCGPGIIVAAMLAAITAFAVLGQPVGQPKFEVASIKPSLGQGLMTVRALPGRLTADASVRLLMRNAYNVQPFQIVGGPDWTGSERYQIEAKADGNTSRDRMFFMLQSLLEDRFQLKSHREIRELPVYALVAARGGLKLPAPKEGGCVDPAPDAPPEWTEGRMTPPGQGQAPLARCGGVSVILEIGGARMQGGKIPMPEFIRALSMVLGRTVIDKTGFTGLFDVRLDFLPDETTAALPPPPPDAAGTSGDSRNPSVLTALQEQHGLRLEATKGPAEVIVIDHVERPSAN